jgi:hypothetical protein
MNADLPVHWESLAKSHLRHSPDGGLSRNQFGSLKLIVRIPSHGLLFIWIEPGAAFLHPFSSQLLVSEHTIIETEFGATASTDLVITWPELKIAAIPTNRTCVFVHARHSQSASKKSRFVANLCGLRSAGLPAGDRTWYVTNTAGLSLNTIPYSPVASRKRIRLASVSSAQCRKHSSTSGGQSPSHNADARATYSSEVATWQSAAWRRKCRRSCLSDAKLATSYRPRNGILSPWYLNMRSNVHHDHAS